MMSELRASMKGKYGTVLLLRHHPNRVVISLFCVTFRNSLMSLVFPLPALPEMKIVFPFPDVTDSRLSFIYPSAYDFVDCARNLAYVADCF